jgi:methionyl-tRNA formyltransferase
MSSGDAAAAAAAAGTSTTRTHARIALFTVRSFAVENAIRVIEERPDATLVCVLTTPGPKSRRSTAHIQVLQALYDHGYSNIDVIISNKRSTWADLLAVHQVNLILCSGFPWLIPESIIHDPRIELGVLNIHNSRLPQYVGPNAFGHAIVNGDTELGYCCHRMSAEFDTGPILFDVSVPIDVNEDYQDLKLRMPEIYRGMIDRAITAALARDPGMPQSGERSYAPKFSDDFRWIDFHNDTALDIHNKVRAYYGERDHPKGALAVVDEGTICITKTRFRTHACVESETPAAVPGTILSRDKDSFFVQCKDTSLEVLEWHPVSDAE